MATNERSVGACPVCGAGLSSASIIIEYDTTAGTAAFACCGDCRAIVHPR
jgi:formate dehydrogenase maturation protein FdhE